jgi:hypothetical protein
MQEHSRSGPPWQTAGLGLMKLPIDHIIAKVQDFVHHYVGVAIEAPTHFTRSHWIVLSLLACTFGFICLRGFGSRKNY